MDVSRIAQDVKEYAEAHPPKRHTNTFDNTFDNTFNTWTYISNGTQVSGSDQSNAYIKGTLAYQMQVVSDEMKDAVVKLSAVLPAMDFSTMSFNDAKLWLDEYHKEEPK